MSVWRWKLVTREKKPWVLLKLNNRGKPQVILSKQKLKELLFFSLWGKHVDGDRSNVWKSNLQSVPRSWELSASPPCTSVPPAMLVPQPLPVTDADIAVLPSAFWHVFLDKYSFSPEAVSSLPASYFSIFNLFIFLSRCCSHSLFLAWCFLTFLPFPIPITEPDINARPRLTLWGPL